jgi:hypothetical protein
MFGMPQNFSEPWVSCSRAVPFAQVQNQLLAALSGHRISGIKRFNKYLPCMAMTVDDAGLGSAEPGPVLRAEVIDHA